MVVVVVVVVVDSRSHQGKMNEGTRAVDFFVLFT